MSFGSEVTKTDWASSEYLGVMEHCGIGVLGVHAYVWVEGGKEEKGFPSIEDSYIEHHTQLSCSKRMPKENWHNIIILSGYSDTVPVDR